MMPKETSTENEAGLNLDDEDRLPWLEAADDYDDDGAVSPSRLLVMVLGGLLLIGAALGGLWWVQNGGSRGEGELIAAQKGGYKVSPANDNAKVFEGEGDASFAASEGAEPTGKVDASRMPEEPAVTPEAKAAARAVADKAAADKAATTKLAASKAPAKPAAPGATPAKMATAAAEPAPSSGGSSTIQLGAFSSEESAAKAWISLSKRFGYLAGMSKSVVPASVGGSNVYRLRAVAGSPAVATSICGKLKVAGENCAVIR